MPARKRSNPLALAVLSCLAERPMHPYEMATTMRSRGKEESIKLNYGSLYTVVDALQRQGLIEPQEVVREGRRPERTVYALTEEGRVEFVDWLTELISVPVKEYTQFEAALSLLPALPPEDVLALLSQRAIRLQLEITRMESVRGVMADQGLPRLFGVESEYRIALLRAELGYVQALMDDIESGELGFVDEWASWHDASPNPRRPLSPGDYIKQLSESRQSPLDIQGPFTIEQATPAADIESQQRGSSRRSESEVQR